MPLPRLGRLMSTMASSATRRRPSLPRAISGWAPIIPAWVRSMALWTSDSDPARSTTTLSKEPVATRVRRKPSESISTAAKTKTTNAMPAAVRNVVSRRARRLR